MMQAIDLYRRGFRPSAQLERPYVMLGFNVFAADDDAQARLLATSVQQSFVSLRSGHPIALPPPLEGYENSLPPAAKALLADALSASAIGSPDTVRAALAAFIARTQPDELMLTSQIFDHAARLHSYEIVAGLHAEAAFTPHARGARGAA
jgi:alkanesulfonate monooxygenase SsuD/methylene tetrahydromethanopterin reductase-like flavin-dependent oxidoreductase (luciferase family)